MTARIEARAAIAARIGALNPSSLKIGAVLERRAISGSIRNGAAPAANGSANVYILGDAAGTNDYTAPLPAGASSYPATALCLVRFANANTGPGRLRWTGLAYLPVTKPNGAALAADDVNPNVDYLLRLVNGASFRIIPGFQ
jgi:hypothetical protein